jgi:hypothetical protein
LTLLASSQAACGYPVQPPDRGAIPRLAPPADPVPGLAEGPILDRWISAERRILSGWIPAERRVLGGRVSAEEPILGGWVPLDGRP